MQELVAAVEIESSAERVWAILTDLSSFSEWNPFVCHASGSTRVGSEVRVRVQSSLGARVPFRATVIACHAERELVWRGYVFWPSLARGEHSFVIEPIDDARVRFVQRERFGGLLPWLLARWLERETRRGFVAMNRALKARAEWASTGAGVRHA